MSGKETVIEQGQVIDSDKIEIEDKWTRKVLKVPANRLSGQLDTPPLESSKPPNRPPPEVPKPDPLKTAFALELAKHDDRLEAMRLLEPLDDKVRAEQVKLATCIEEMGKGEIARNYKLALEHLKAAVAQADKVQEAHEAAGKAERDFYIEYQAIAHRRQPALDAQPPTEWTKKAKATFVTADDELQKQIVANDWPKATTQLGEVVKALDGFDIAARQELESKLTILDGWAPAKAEAGKLRVALGKIKPPVLGNEAYPRLANEIGAEMTGWRDVRLHTTAMAKLDSEFGYVALIPGKDDTNSPLAKEWAAYKKAKAEAPVPSTIVNTDNHDKLAGLRDAYAEAGRALGKAYQAGTPGPADDPYYKTIAQEISARTIVLFRQGNKVPDTTPQITKLKEEMNGLTEATFPTWKKRVEDLLGAEAKGLQLIALRLSSSDPASVAMYDRYRKVQTSLKAAADLVPKTGATPLQTEYQQKYLAFMAKLGGADEDRVKVCNEGLDWLIPKAEELLKTATDALKNTAKITKELPEKRTAQKNTKAEAARAAIMAADPVILSRLSAEEKMDLLDSLRVAGMPDFDANDKNQNSDRNKKRTAMKKLYMALTLEEEFAKKDAENRQKLMKALEGKKQELKDAKENWSAMTDDQKLELLKMVATEQCAQFGFTLPSNGVIAVNEPNSSDNGSYSPGRLDRDPPGNSPENDRIKINTAMPVFHDFEAALDLILHENTHRNQNVLVAAMRYPKRKDGKMWLTKDNADPPFTQTRMFDMGNVDGGYVTGAEDYEVYKKQPEEDHAWLAGPRGAQGIMDMLAKP